VHGYDPLFGARFLRRTLEREITSALAGLLVQGRPARGARARLTVRRDRIEARLVPPEQPVPARRAPVVLPAGSTTETRTLDRAALVVLARGTRHAAGGLLAALEEKRRQVSRLLDVMNAPGFWDRGADTREVLDQYRRLDVAVQVEERFAHALRALEAPLRDPEAGDTARLARAVDTAARALREWQDRLAEEGASDVWLLLERTDPFRPADTWLIDLARMELAWCARRHLQAGVVACEMTDGELSRLVLHVEGPGARASLAAEEGLHVRDRKAGPDLRARITLVDRQPDDPAARETVTRTRRREGPLGLALVCVTRLEVASSGMTIELLGGDARTLADLRHDLDTHVRQRTGRDGSDVARTYGRDGVGARDPRTGATVVRLKDALRGELGSLFEAWRAGGTETVAT
jgi:ATP-dependent Clp protease ATP-binding subunit ClpC